jgi:putative hemolysin
MPPTTGSATFDAAAIEIVITLVLIIANGIFVLSEASLLAARQARLRQRLDDGDKRAEIALNLVAAPNNFLATVQIFITLIGTLLGAFSGATLSRPLAQALGTVPQLRPYSEGLSLGIVVVIVTYLTLIIGELVPKSIALNNPEGSALVIARPMHMLSRLASPLVTLLNVSSELVIRLLDIKTPSEPAVTEDEIRVMITQGTEAGTFEDVERQIVDHVFQVSDMHVGALMTPRTELAWLNVNDTQEEIFATLRERPFARYPVTQDTLDNVLGMVRTTDILTHLVSNKPFDLRSIVIAPVFVPETMTVYKVLDTLRVSNVHTALVMDEYGGLLGLITLNDVLEEIVGDALLPQENLDSPQVVNREDGSWLVDGILPIERLKSTLGLKALAGEEQGNYQTVGGFIMAQLGRIPTASEHFELENFRFEVMDMDGHRVDKVLVQPLNPSDDAIPATAEADDTTPRPA